jgi:hypothetical protein
MRAYHRLVRGWFQIQEGQIPSEATVAAWIAEATSMEAVVAH